MKHISPPLLLLAALLFSWSLSAQSITRADLQKYHEVNEYIAKHKPSREVIDSLLATLPSATATVTVADMVPFFDESMSKLDISKAVDGLYLTEGLRNGIALDEARDAVSFTTLYPFRRPNSRDYQKLFEVFSTDCAPLHDAYLEKIPFMLRNSGPSEHTPRLRELIAANAAESPLKDSALKVIDDFMPLAPGCPAPEVALLDEKGAPRSFADYVGKTLVVDVWASWCHNCRKKMPQYLAMRKANSDAPVVFLTLSIDRAPQHSKWIEASRKHSLPSATNLIAAPSGDNDKSQFETIYCVGGVPRYIVIGPDGNIVDAFAPADFTKIQSLIDSTL
ncbi:MAG: TlpA family protein disulfide reductase [Duncaniella sp.]|nr:TlpA family protein disulfide reductase [Duncaniella sp.]